MALPNDPTTTPNLPQVNNSTDTWDPVTISNIILSAIMVFIGIVAIWQAHRAHCRARHALNLEEEEIIGIRVLSRSSTIPANAPAGLDPSAPSSQAALTTQSIEGHETIETLTHADRADTLGGTPVAAATCI